ncbi:MAG: sulfur oxidation c-type cytochrome SoxX [Gammaproteobacteria bacterium]|nr:sulfur oxidation c-type cytochrome SoxX [Gammaproteobacteria bacterium]
MKINSKSLLVASVTVFLLTACVGVPVPDYDKLAQDMMKQSFRDQGIAMLDRLVQDESNKHCSQADMLGKPLEETLGKEIEEANLKTVKMPSDGIFLGDWKEGEKIAQNGRGATWNDKADAINGGSCYNCHQLSKQELSYGTIGPSLYNYGKIRGVSDPTAVTAKPIVEYTWGKLWNAKAYNACSNMPRFGHKQLLTEKQIQHIMALLLDPGSPINQ